MHQQNWPDFELFDESGKKWTLQDLLDKWTLIYFYPKDNTPGCTQQACEMNSQRQNWSLKGVHILGVSADSAKSHQKFKSLYNLEFPLLIDEASLLMKQLGIWKLKSMYGKTYWGAERSAFLLDKETQIVWSEKSVKLAGHLERVKQAITHHVQ